MAALFQQCSLGQDVGLSFLKALKQSLWSFMKQAVQVRKKQACFKELKILKVMQKIAEHCDVIVFQEPILFLSHNLVLNFT